MKTTDQRKLINTYKKQIIIINNPLLADPPCIVRDCFPETSSGQAVPRNDVFFISIFQLNPNRRVVTCFLPSAYIPVHATCNEMIFELRTQQKMIYP
jgi:hypothetical protein